MKSHLAWLALLLVGCGQSQHVEIDAGAQADAALDGGPIGELDGAMDAAVDAAVDAAFDASAAVDEGAAMWRSALYPADWTPSFEDEDGRYLHDFSFAGYHNGMDVPGAPPDARITDVVAEYGVDPTGTSDATADVQRAINACSTSGGVVYFPGGIYRFDGTLSVTHSNVVLRGAGRTATRLYFTSFAGMENRAHIQVSGSVVENLEVPLAVDGAARADIVEVADAAELSVGDDVSIGWTITEEFVAEHGMTGTWRVFNGQWRPFFRRQVLAIDRTTSPHRVQLDVPLRYRAQVRDGASVRRETGYLHEVGIESMSVSNAVAVADAWAQDLVRAIQFTGVADGWIQDVASFASPISPTTGGYAGSHLQSQGISIQIAKRVTVADCDLGYAENRGSGGNGYLYEVMESSEILFHDDSGTFGRHNFIENYGFGTTGCVWLRVHSSNGRCDLSPEWGEIGISGECTSEFHHSLAMANLIDSSTLDDGWKAVNRGSESSGSGHSSTESVFWNSRGAGTIVSMQYGIGYVVGTDGVDVRSSGTLTSYPLAFDGTLPEDFVEGLGLGSTLEPQSLYESQLARRSRL